MKIRRSLENKMEKKLLKIAVKFINKGMSPRKISEGFVTVAVHVYFCAVSNKKEGKQDLLDGIARVYDTYLERSPSDEK